jgi:hypothetical protein
MPKGESREGGPMNALWAKKAEPRGMQISMFWPGRPFYKVGVRRPEGVLHLTSSLVGADVKVDPKKVAQLSKRHGIGCSRRGTYRAAEDRYRKEHAGSYRYSIVPRGSAFAQLAIDIVSILLFRARILVIGGE